MTTPTALTDADIMLRSELIERGVTDVQLRHAVRTGRLVRPRQGTYVEGERWRSLDRLQQHLLLVRGVLRRFGPGYVASHHSAVVAHGLPAWGLDLRDVDLTRLDGSHPRRTAGVAVHVGRLGVDDLTTLDGLQVTSGTRAVLDSMSTSSAEAAVVTASLAVNRGITTLHDLVCAHRRVDRWPGMAAVPAILGVVDGACTSVGEARALHLFDRAGIPRPTCQVRIPLLDGSCAYADYYWHQYRHVAEFDGRLKYLTLPGDADGAARAVYAEKRREDAIRSLGLGVTRFAWSELDGPGADRLVARLRSDLDRSRRLYARTDDLALVERGIVVRRRAS